MQPIDFDQITCTLEKILEDLEDRPGAMLDVFESIERIASDELSDSNQNAAKAALTRVRALAQSGIEASRLYQGADTIYAGLLVSLRHNNG